METTTLAILISVISLILSVVAISQAKKARDHITSLYDASQRSNRIGLVFNNYIKFVNDSKSSHLRGLSRAGIATLLNETEAVEVIKQIEAWKKITIPWVIEKLILKVLA